MVKITHQGENAEKAEAILVAAQKRFGLYGLEKTTMQEIAADLNISKGTLYYYFPDKEELYMAVVEKEQLLFIESVSSAIAGNPLPSEKLLLYAGIRIEYFRKLANLSRMRTTDFHSMKKFLGKSWSKFSEEEIKIISGIIESGVKQGFFRSSDIRKDSALYLELLRGLRMVLMKSKDLVYLEDDEFNLLREKVNRFTQLFVNGLKQ